MAKSTKHPDDAAPNPGGWRMIFRAMVAGVVVALVVFALIKGFRPALFEDRADRIVEQCVKTGLSVFAFSLLLSLAAAHRARP